ncbi:MAG: hypothetical protein AB1391_00005 [Candidatus Micrarchaeota archaeon]
MSWCTKSGTRLMLLVKKECTLGQIETLKKVINLDNKLPRIEEIIHSKSSSETLGKCFEDYFRDHISRQIKEMFSLIFERFPIYHYISHLDNVNPDEINKTVAELKTINYNITNLKKAYLDTNMPLGQSNGISSLRKEKLLLISSLYANSPYHGLFETLTDMKEDLRTEVLSFAETTSSMSHMSPEQFGFLCAILSNNIGCAFDNNRKYYEFRVYRPGLSVVIKISYDHRSYDLNITRYTSEKGPDGCTISGGYHIKVLPQSQVADELARLTRLFV